MLFYRPEDQPSLSPEEVREAMAGLSHVTEDHDEQSGTTTYWYENPATSVQWSLSFVGSEEEAGEAPPEFRGLRATALSFVLDYVRPSFFAAEAMPIVVDVAEELGLLTYDGQRTDSKGRKPRKYSAAELIRSWEEGNAPEARGVRGHTQRYVSHCPRERLDYYWQYMRHREKLEQRYGEADIAVPEIDLLWPTKGGSTILACTWTNLARTVLPEVDYVLVRREIRRLGGLISRDEEGFVALRELRDLTGEALEERTEPVLHLVYGAAEPAPDVVEAVMSVPLMELEEGYERTEPQRVVDVPPG